MILAIEVERTKKIDNMMSYHDMNGSEKIVAILPNVQVQRTFGMVREYEIIVVENGLFFHLTTGAWRLGIRQGITGGISGGLGGALPGEKELLLGVSSTRP